MMIMETYDDEDDYTIYGHKDDDDGKIHDLDDVNDDDNDVIHDHFNIIDDDHDCHDR